MSELESEWIVGWKNIITESYVGESNGYTCDETAVNTTNGAGGRNVQLFMIAPDGVVVHALAGFWHPDDLVSELKFARTILLPLWRDRKLTRPKKDAVYAVMQRDKAASNSEATRRRSRWQGFDANNERNRFEKQGERDSVLLDAAGEPLKDERGLVKLKTLDVLLHDRMAKRPFIRFEHFDVLAFADYGRPHYDNNFKEKGTTLMTPPKVALAERLARQERLRASLKAKAKERRLRGEAARAEALAAQVERTAEAERIRKDAERVERIARRTATHAKWRRLAELIDDLQRDLQPSPVRVEP